MGDKSVRPQNRCCSLFLHCKKVWSRSEVISWSSAEQAKGTRCRIRPHGLSGRCRDLWVTCSVLHTDVFIKCIVVKVGTSFSWPSSHRENTLWYSWSHERLKSQPGVAGASAALDFVSCCWCSRCCECRTRRSCQKPEKRRRWRQRRQWRRKCGKEKEVSPHPTWPVQLHLHPAGIGCLPGRRTSRRVECRAERLAASRQWMVSSETAAPGEHNGEQHAVVAEGKRQTVFFSFPSLKTINLLLTSVWCKVDSWTDEGIHECFGTWTFNRTFCQTKTSHPD